MNHWRSLVRGKELESLDVDRIQPREGLCVGMLQEFVSVVSWHDMLQSSRNILVLIFLIL